jgi:hypothetical protein
MSNDRAIAAVTATLRAVIYQAVNAEPDLGGTQVTARPPDRARQAVPGNLINLFLYHTSIDAAWRNHNAAWQHPGDPGQPPLPLILSYLVTSYGENDDEVLSHRLLGLAMSVLHSRPLLAPADIAVALPGSELEAQIESVRITPHTVRMDEVSRLWTTFQSPYRITAGYDAAVVLIDTTAPARAPLPVLRVGASDTGPAVIPQLQPVLQGAFPADGLPNIPPGGTFTLAGTFLQGVTHVRLSSLRLASPVVLPAAVTPDGVQVTLPAAPSVPAGQATAEALAALDDGPLVSNRVPVALAPVITSQLPLSGTLANGSASVSLDCAPPVAPGQTVALVVGDRVVLGSPGEPGTPARTHLDFRLTGFAAGTYPVRLRIDGQDSSLLRADNPTEFDPSQSLVLA